MALLAFEDPFSSPFSDLLALSHRQQVKLFAAAHNITILVWLKKLFCCHYKVAANSLYLLHQSKFLKAFLKKFFAKYILNLRTLKKTAHVPSGF